MRELETQDLGLWGGDMAGINSEEEEAERWNAIINKGQKWPNGVIPYVFDSGAFSSSEQSLINSALSSFSSRFRCLKAVPRTRERYVSKRIFVPSIREVLSYLSSESLKLVTKSWKVGVILEDI